MEPLKKNDFIELEYTGRIKDGSIFDTNIKEEAKKVELEIESRPLVICIGQNMILPAIDEFLIGKDLGKHTLELSPEKAFGVRSRDYIKTMPLRVFTEKEIMPRAGMVFNFDNLFGRVSAVSGGRVIVDFNNPLAGKEVIYELNAKKIVEKLEEKAENLLFFLFRRKLEFKLEEKKIKVKVEKQFIPLIDYFKPKFKEILDLDLEAEEIKTEEEKKEKPEEKK